MVLKGDATIIEPLLATSKQNAANWLEFEGSISNHIQWDGIAESCRHEWPNRVHNILEMEGRLATLQNGKNIGLSAIVAVQGGANTKTMERVVALALIIAFIVDQDLSMEKVQGYWNDALFLSLVHEAKDSFASTSVP